MSRTPIVRAFGGYGNSTIAGRWSDYADVTAPAESYWPNDYGLYNMAGNVCEMVKQPGISRGGSWRDPGYYLQNSVRQTYKGKDTSSSKRGFRTVIKVIEP